MMTSSHWFARVKLIAAPLCMLFVSRIMKFSPLTFMLFRPSPALLCRTVPMSMMWTRFTRLRSIREVFKCPHARQSTFQVHLFCGGLGGGLPISALHDIRSILLYPRISQDEYSGDESLARQTHPNRSPSLPFAYNRKVLHSKYLHKSELQTLQL